MPKRDPALDLIRCVAFILVMGYHFFLFNGYHSQEQIGLAMWCAGCARSLTLACNGLFLMLSGYLAKERHPIKHILRVILCYLIASAISIPIRVFYLGDTSAPSVWLTRLASFRGVYYGQYAEMYIGLALILPFLCRLADTLTPRRMIMLAASFFALSALPGMTRMIIAPSYWRGLYPITYVILGITVKKFDPRPPKLLCLAAATLISCGLGCAAIISTNGNLASAFTQEFGDGWAVLIALSLFLGLRQTKPHTHVAKILGFAARGCFGGYLLAHLIDSHIYTKTPLSSLRSPDGWGKLFILGTLPGTAAALILGFAMERAAEFILKGAHDRKIIP